MMLEMLHEYSDTIYKEVHKKGKSRADNEFLFPIYYAGSIKPITRQSFWIILKKMWAKSGSDKTNISAQTSPFIGNAYAQKWR